MEILPAVMPRSFVDLEEKMSQVSGLVPVLQIDVMDGVFVQNKSWPYIGDEGEFGEVTSGEREFPYESTLDFEVDLMVSEPASIIESWVMAGAKRFVLHKESTKDFQKLLRVMRTYTTSDDNFLIKTEIGMAVNIETPIEEIFPFVDQIDFVQFMGISRIGFQGEQFNDTALGKIRMLREAYPSMIISVDGGVNINTAQDLADAGVNRLVAGSAVFESEDVAEAIKELQNI
ncbi:MAG: hypothetical protein WC757_03180 [Candidatus Paceibacterota bacterium]|jgi:ribulose-phosphate 3-epimerase